MVPSQSSTSNIRTHRSPTYLDFTGESVCVFWFRCALSCLGILHSNTLYRENAMPVKSDSETSLPRQQSYQRCLGAICSTNYAQVMNQSIAYAKCSKVCVFT